MNESSRRDAIKLTTTAGAAALGAAVLSHTRLFAQLNEPTSRGDLFDAHSDVTFESIDARVAQLKLPDNLRSISMAESGAADLPARFRADLCSYYHAVRAIFVVLSQVPLIPVTWRRAISGFVVVMDQICGL